MGIDCYASVFYGFPIEDWRNYDDVLEEDYDNDWEEAYLAAKGLATYEHTHSEVDDYNQWKRECEESGCKKEYEKWYTNKNAIMETCAAGIHPLGDDGGYIVAIKGAGATSSWDTVEIDPKNLTIKPEWDQQIKDFCDLMHIPYERPKWYLTSYLW